jgi:formylglycine-generating enzyme required for sulfatase activity
MNPPRCFISYSWDSDQHKEWVRKLATRLRESGVDAILDQFECAPGTDLTKFMETSVRESNFVLLVCTPTFSEKANAGIGGVGYEKAIVTGEIFAGEAQETKFVPILREGETKESLPSYLKSRLFIDFRLDDNFESKLEELLRHFHSEPLYPPPPIGLRPDWGRATDSPPNQEPPTTLPNEEPKRPTPSQKMPLQERIKDSIGIEFLLIPVGKYRMGSGSNPEETSQRFGDSARLFESEHPQHEVNIRNPFYLQTTQVTVGHWRKFIYEKQYKSEAEREGHSNIWNGSAWINKKGAHWGKPSFTQNDNHPVTCVSWNDTQEFIQWLNRMEDNYTYRLPTEAEWEYACRSGTTTEFSFGDNAKDLAEYAWYSQNSDNQTHRVGVKNPNKWGLYDMHGNVWEWVEDDWHINYDQVQTDEKAWIYDKRGDHRVLRGGSWKYDAQYSRSAARFYWKPSNRDNNLGFRLAKSIPFDP